MLNWYLPISLKNMLPALWLSVNTYQVLTKKIKRKKRGIKEEQSIGLFRSEERRVDNRNAGSKQATIRKKENFDRRERILISRVTEPNKTQ